MTRGILAFEGVANSGKTTLARELEGDRFAVIGEIFDVFDVPVYDCFDDEERHNSDMWFVSTECRRWETARELATERVAVMDRCVLSQIVHIRTRFDVFRQTTNRSVWTQMKDSFRTGRLGFPDAIVIFSSLHGSRDPSPHLYQSEAFIARASEIYDLLLQEFPGLMYLDLNRIDGGMDRSALVVNALSTPGAPPTVEALESLLEIRRCIAGYE